MFMHLRFGMHLCDYRKKNSDHKYFSRHLCVYMCDTCNWPNIYLNINISFLSCYFESWKHDFVSLSTLSTYYSACLSNVILYTCTSILMKVYSLNSKLKEKYLCKPLHIIISQDDFKANSLLVMKYFFMLRQEDLQNSKKKT